MQKIFSRASIILAMLIPALSYAEQSSTSQPLSPIAQIIKLHPDLGYDVKSVQISQENSQVNVLRYAKVTVLEQGIADDSVSAINTLYSFRYIPQKGWEMMSKEQQYLCSRGKNTTTFQTDLCP